MPIEWLKEYFSLWGDYPVAAITAALIGGLIATYVCRSQYIGRIGGLVERVNLKDDYIRDLSAKLTAAETMNKVVDERDAAVERAPDTRNTLPSAQFKQQPTEISRRKPDDQLSHDTARFENINRQITDSLDRTIKDIVTRDRFKLVFNPVSGGSKIITFLPDGQIGEGKNKNEASWRVSDGRLEILQSDGRVHSRFILHSDKKSFHHTNDPETLSVKGQYLIRE